MAELPKVDEMPIATSTPLPSSSLKRASRAGMIGPIRIRRNGWRRDGAMQISARRLPGAAMAPLRFRCLTAAETSPSLSWSRTLNRGGGPGPERPSGGGGTVRDPLGALSRRLRRRSQARYRWGVPNLTEIGQLGTHFHLPITRVFRSRASNSSRFGRRRSGKPGTVASPFL